MNEFDPDFDKELLVDKQVWEERQKYPGYHETVDKEVSALVGDFFDHLTSDEEAMNRFVPYPERYRLIHTDFMADLHVFQNKLAVLTSSSSEQYGELSDGYEYVFNNLPLILTEKTDGSVDIIPLGPGTSVTGKKIGYDVSSIPSSDYACVIGSITEADFIERRDEFYWGLCVDLIYAQTERDGVIDDTFTDGEIVKIPIIYPGVSAARVLRKIDSLLPGDIQQRPIDKDSIFDMEKAVGSQTLGQIIEDYNNALYTTNDIKAHEQRNTAIDEIHCLLEFSPVDSAENFPKDEDVVLLSSEHAYTSKNLETAHNVQGETCIFAGITIVQLTDEKVWNIVYTFHTVDSSHQVSGTIFVQPSKITEARGL